MDDERPFLDTGKNKGTGSRKTELLCLRLTD
jgi:hypothetical protein